ncbi:unnamed protein product [Rangifer tarandus platyrhynchus]|uniref:Uncharacterized protein n=2 Tax=Rangifer tarandus platyrhynchus TaxID=3082113 RepID=A0ACB0ECB3_RANTA|nr:unnamed protein product [Rangifer tarandus platyrhynchus]CAI9698019.1 unnamed protein product [Rangifer tarandus platyrhynchus]
MVLMGAYGKFLLIALIFLSESRSKVRVKVKDEATRPGPPASVPAVSLCPGGQDLVLRGGEDNGVPRPSPRPVHPPDESAAGSAGWRPRLPGPGRWEKPSSRCSGFLLLSRPGLSGLPRLLSAGPAARGPRRAGRLLRGPARPLRRRARGAAAPGAGPARPGVLAGASRPLPAPTYLPAGRLGAMAGVAGRERGRGAGSAAAASRGRSPRVCLDVRAAGLILAAPGEMRLLPSLLLLLLSPGKR